MSDPKDWTDEEWLIAMQIEPTPPPLGVGDKVRYKSYLSEPLPLTPPDGSIPRRPDIVDVVELVIGADGDRLTLESGMVVAASRVTRA